MELALRLIEVITQFQRIGRSSEKGDIKDVCALKLRNPPPVMIALGSGNMQRSANFSSSLDMYPTLPVKFLSVSSKIELTSSLRFFR